MKDSFAETEALFDAFNPDVPPVTEDVMRQMRTPENESILLEKLDSLVEMAGFQKMPDSMLTCAQRMDFLRGCSVSIPAPNRLSVQLYYRRMLPTTVVRPSWPFWCRSKPRRAKIFDCVIARFQEFPASNVRSVLEVLGGPPFTPAASLLTLPSHAGRGSKFIILTPVCRCRQARAVGAAYRTSPRHLIKPKNNVHRCTCAFSTMSICTTFQ